MLKLAPRPITLIALLLASTLTGCVIAPKPVLEIHLKTSIASPEVVNPGDTVNIRSGYSLNVPGVGRTVDVRESYALKKNGDVLITSEPVIRLHSTGEYSIDAAIPIPPNAAPGTYVVETKVKADTAFDKREVTFVVERSRAQYSTGNGGSKKGRGNHRKR